MNVVDYLKRFLAENPQQEAAIPGLGVFYAGQKNGKDCILFKEVMPTNKAFLNFLAFEENIPEEAARTELEKWVRKVLQDLKATGSVNISGVGTFSIMGDKVDFVPSFAKEENRTVNFGLENPSAAPVSANTGAAHVPSGNPVQVSANPVRNVSVSSRSVESGQGGNFSDRERPRQRNTYRSNAPREPQRPQRPVANPASSGKEILLDGNRSRRETVKPTPFYATWWFIVCCVVVAVAVVLFAVTPIRERILGTGTARMVEMGVVQEKQMENMLEEGLEQLLAEEDLQPAEAVMSEEDAAIVRENAQVAEEVIAGEARRREIDAQAKRQKEPQVRTEPKPEPRPEVKPTSRPASKPQPKPEPQTKPAPKPKPAPAQQKAEPQTGRPGTPVKADVKNPMPGMFYIIVGSFTSEANARNMADKMRAAGYQPEILFIKAKDFYYVSVKTCRTREEAVTQRSDLRDNRNMDCWIFAN